MSPFVPSTLQHNQYQTTHVAERTIKKIAAFIIAGAIGVVLSAGPIVPSVQQAPAQTEAKPAGIEGLWCEIWYENQGKIYSSLPQAIRPPGGLGPDCGTKWQISKDCIEVGSVDDHYPRRIYSYKPAPGGKAGAIEISRVWNDPKTPKLTYRAIYEVRGDILVICMTDEKNGKRPEKLTTSGLGADIWSIVLRRGELNWSPLRSGGPM